MRMLALTNTVILHSIKKLLLRWSAASGSLPLRVLLICISSNASDIDATSQALADRSAPIAFGAEVYSEQFSADRLLAEDCIYNMSEQNIVDVFAATGRKRCSGTCSRLTSLSTTCRRKGFTCRRTASIYLFSDTWEYWTGDPKDPASRRCEQVFNSYPGLVDASRCLRFFRIAFKGSLGGYNTSYVHSHST